MQVYGVPKVWKQMNREGMVVARCTVAADEAAGLARCSSRQASLHDDSRYVSIRYSERLAEAGIEPSVGSRGDSYDNALAETINGLYKTELIHRRTPWKTRESVELATLEWGLVQPSSIDGTARLYSARRR
ncbi:hypothetical protein SAMN06265784_103283 [Paraburkholderia susongensis]|uniref:Integrase core domain-containing protein n=1 Tax=Paraburkholderia susongensis TaxID=1515439 RepID=A0A1X7K362_9BURK|nr:hypothetical protein SAMN06265784_103283 [Paraburkholderia susongensis]